MHHLVPDHLKFKGQSVTLQEIVQWIESLPLEEQGTASGAYMDWLRNLSSFKEERLSHMVGDTPVSTRENTTATKPVKNKAR